MESWSGRVAPSPSIQPRQVEATASHLPSFQIQSHDKSCHATQHNEPVLLYCYICSILSFLACIVLFTFMCFDVFRLFANSFASWDLFGIFQVCARFPRSMTKPATTSSSETWPLPSQTHCHIDCTSAHHHEIHEIHEQCSNLAHFGSFHTVTYVTYMSHMSHMSHHSPVYIVYIVYVHPRGKTQCRLIQKFLCRLMLSSKRIVSS